MTKEIGIRELSSFNQDFTFKVKVLNKSEPRTMKNRGTGKEFTFSTPELGDLTGRVELIAYESLASKMASAFEDGKVCLYEEGKTN